MSHTPHAATPHAAAGDRGWVRGEIVAARHPDGGPAHLHLIIDTNSNGTNGSGTSDGEGGGEGQVTVMLLCADVEIASEVDAVLDGAATRLGYTVAALTRYQWQLPAIRIIRSVGHVDETTVRDLETLAAVDDGDVPVERGIALQPEICEPRWPALEALSRLDPNHPLRRAS